MSQALLNQIWSHVLLQELQRLGVKQVVFAPGARSTPLILEASSMSGFSLHSHFDERALAFFALGLAKACKQKVAIIVTSGTAVANLLPAVAEASLTGESLVLLTADRPIELIDCGANQAINQMGMFTNFTSAELMLPTPSRQVPLSWLLTSVNNAIKNQTLQGGVVHINCPFAEPLFGVPALVDLSLWTQSCAQQQKRHEMVNYLNPIKAWLEQTTPYVTHWRSASKLEQSTTLATDVQQMLSQLFNKQGIIIAANLSKTEAVQVKRLAQRLGWPLLADPQSGLSGTLPYYDLWLQSTASQQRLGECDCIIQFGAQLISKPLMDWIGKQVQDKQTPYWYFSADPKRNNPMHLSQHQWVVNIENFVSSLLEWVEPNQPKTTAPLTELNKITTDYQKALRQYLNKQHSITDLHIAHQIDKLPGGCEVFLGNSLFVRLVDKLAKMKDLSTWSNRGASGIDGLIATAAGIAQHQQAPMVQFIGDVSALYDLTSLALLSKLTHPFVLVILNNDGGAIFSSLNIEPDKKIALYQQPHGLDFANAAAQFKLPYECVKNLSAYQSKLMAHLTSGTGAIVMEIRFNEGESLKQLKHCESLVHAFC